MFGWYLGSWVFGKVLVDGILGFVWNVCYLEGFVFVVLVEGFVLWIVVKMGIESSRCL